MRSIDVESAPAAENHGTTSSSASTEASESSARPATACKAATRTAAWAAWPAGPTRSASTLGSTEPSLLFPAFPHSLV
jgi:hypothetical protein